MKYILLTIVFCLVGVPVLAQEFSICQSYEECLQPPSEGLHIFEKRGKCDGSADCRYVEVLAQDRILLAIAYKLDEISKGQSMKFPRVLKVVGMEDTYVYDDGMDDGVELIKKQPTSKVEFERRDRCIYECAKNGTSFTAALIGCTDKSKETITPTTLTPR